MARVWTCPKCNQHGCETGEVRAAGSFLAKVFNVENRKFTTVTCRTCRYTELYAADSSELGNLLDFAGN